MIGALLIRHAQVDQLYGDNTIGITSNELLQQSAQKSHHMDKDRTREACFENGTKKYLEKVNEICSLLFLKKTLIDSMGQEERDGKSRNANWHKAAQIVYLYKLSQDIGIHFAIRQR